jgi:DNA-binding beta-propeller fold protein YncE
VKHDIRHNILVIFFASLVWFFESQTAFAQFIIDEHQITSPGYSTTPTLGADATGPIIVYTGRLVPTGLGTVDGTSSEAIFYAPAGIVASAAGMPLYVTTGDHNIRKIY